MEKTEPENPVSTEEEEEEEEQDEDEDEEEEEEKWVTHYSSNHEILLIGDGDFSFSLCLATCFGSASNIVATSLHSYGCVIKMYNQAKSNLENLKKLGANIIHEVDATKMKLHADLRMRRFDRIIFNFPHAGFHGKEDDAHLIRMHMKLVNGFFNNARSMLRANGEIHVNHKTTGPFCNWDLEGIGSENSLVLIECVDFKKEDYPGYHNKRGAGPRCDKPFPLGKSSTFKFCFSTTIAKKMSKRHQVHPNPIPAYDSQAVFSFRTPQPLLIHHQHDLGYPLPMDFTQVPANPLPTYHLQAEFPIRMPQPLLNHHQRDFGYPLPMDFTQVRANPIPTYYSQAECPIRMPHPLLNHHRRDFRSPLSTDFTQVRDNPIPTYHSQAECPIRMPHPLLNHHQRDFRYPLSTDFNLNNMNAVFSYGTRVEVDCRRIFSEYFTNAMDTYERNDSVYDVPYSVHNALNQGYARFHSEGRDPKDYIYLLEELHRLSNHRLEWLKRQLLDFQV